MKKMLALVALVGAVTFAAPVWSAENQNGNETKVQLIRNATMRVHYAGKVFLVDPLLIPQYSMPAFPGTFRPRQWQPMAKLPVPVEEVVKGIDAVVLSHFHPDHFDELAAEMLPKDIKFFVQNEHDGEMVKALGFTNVESVKYDGSSFKGVTLYKIDGAHGKKELAEPLFAQLGGRWESSGYVFKRDGLKTIYVAGDTLWVPSVKDAFDKHQPDFAFLNAADARLLATGPIIMGLADLVEAEQAASPNMKLVVVHLDSVSHGMIGRKEIREYVTGNDLSHRFIVPEDGETLYLDRW